MMSLEIPQPPAPNSDAPFKMLADFIFIAQLGVSRLGPMAEVSLEFIGKIKDFLADNRQAEA